MWGFDLKRFLLTNKKSKFDCSIVEIIKIHLVDRLGQGWFNVKG